MITIPTAIGRGKGEGMIEPLSCHHLERCPNCMEKYAALRAELDYLKREHTALRMLTAGAEQTIDKADAENAALSASLAKKEAALERYREAVEWIVGILADPHNPLFADTHKEWAKNVVTSLRRRAALNANP